MNIHGLAAVFAMLLLAATPAAAEPPGGGAPYGLLVVAQDSAQDSPDQPDAEIDPSTNATDGPGNEEGFLGSWFPTVKPESETGQPEAEDSEAIPADELPEVPRDAQYRVERGDTFKEVLVRAGSAPEDAERAIQALAKVYDPRRLQPGIEVFLQLQPQKQHHAPALLSIDFVADPETDVSVIRETDGAFTARTYERTLTPRLAHGRAVIKSSLYHAGQEAGIPSGVLNSFVNLYSFDVDFQRDVQPGDRFEVMYQKLTTEGGAFVMDGEVVLASMTLSGATTTLYRYKTASGYSDYFDENGQSAQKSLLRTPTDAARISSGFGRRKHPILGFTLMHRGIDFAAPAGTPVYAAGDGVIEKAGWAGTYGKYIRIRHGGGYKTAYAHLRRIASGIAEGVRVKQRQVIGYIGATGRATGPHLHYEVIQNNKQVNPQTIRLAAGYRLKGEELEDFNDSVAEMKEHLEAFHEQVAHKSN
jgi:murein DD-endopeptidase MepM/ murein hydrolase activator NlpD